MAKPMRAGQLRNYVTIQQPTASSPNEFGETTDTWTTYARVRAGIIPQNSREFVSAKQVRGEMTHLVEIRSLGGVTSQMRVLFGTRVLNIDGVIDADERNRQMFLACIEEV